MGDTIKAGVAAYKDCAEICEVLLKHPFSKNKTPYLTDEAIRTAEFARKMILTELAKSFRQKADKLALLGGIGGEA